MKKKIRTLLALLVTVASIVTAVIVTATGTATVATFWSLIPPVVAIALALITKEVYPPDSDCRQHVYTGQSVVLHCYLCLSRRFCLR